MNHPTRNYPYDQSAPYSSDDIPPPSGYPYGNAYGRGSYDQQSYYPPTSATTHASVDPRYRSSTPTVAHTYRYSRSGDDSPASQAEIGSSLHPRRLLTLILTIPISKRTSLQGCTRPRDISRVHLDTVVIPRQAQSCQDEQAAARELRTPRPYRPQRNATLAKSAGRPFRDLTTGKDIMKHSTFHVPSSTAVVTAERSSAGLIRLNVILTTAAMRCLHPSEASTDAIHSAVFRSCDIMDALPVPLGSPTSRSPS
ncbi:hypothetical protein Moror_16487 [Moniliophthora roreri MCA 2997]|uniref:Uncharacterized protein n=1 Tax=Moniliophthora roreri (strain MCA 2997) TaxID=1381753 RepID=V2YGM1_MONRO|nr:hypothetical protein Moror_16487 [Moniliophthora roreri MCA 2997]